MLSDKKVVVGMSGGVDSSLSAALLKEAGYEVFGLSLELYNCDRPLGRGCCTPQDRLDARRVCEQLNISHEIIDLREAFRRHVLDYFASEYSRGRTPLPCAPCNASVRFKALLDTADQKGANWIATGHYARVGPDAEGKAALRQGPGQALWRAKDRLKDQSYFLWGLTGDMLGRLKLPIGEFTKEEVRRMAEARGLVTSRKEESQDLCFVGNEDHARFLEEHYPERALPMGDFIDETGKILGRHLGVHAYTIGQRRRLGVSTGERRYVIRLNAANNEVVLGPRKSLQVKGLVARNPNWLSGVFPLMTHDSCLMTVKSRVKIRSTHPGVEATVEAVDGELQVFFQTPQEAVTPGQAAVFYEGERLLGGAWIEKALP